MSRETTRILFAPASGPGGTGEYYRCLTLARTISNLRPETEIEFLLHRDACVERDERFAYHQLSATPARAGDEVIDAIERRRPAVAVFDCTGRVAQFRAAQALGTRVAWISNRPRKRLKGFRPRQMRWMDLHVVVDSLTPEPHLRVHERWLLKFFGRVDVELVRAIVPEPDETALAPWLHELPGDEAFALFVAGGGGYVHAGRPVPELFVEAAQRLRRESGLSAVVVMGPQYRGAVESAPDVTVIRSMPTAALGELLARARLAVIGAGNMLSAQALASQVPLVITAVGGRDQPRRVRRLQRMGQARASRLHPESLCESALAVLRENIKDRGDAAKPSLEDDTRRVARRLLRLAGR